MSTSTTTTTKAALKAAQDEIARLTAENATLRSGGSSLTASVGRSTTGRVNVALPAQVFIHGPRGWSAMQTVGKGGVELETPRFFQVNERLCELLDRAQASFEEANPKDLTEKGRLTTFLFRG